MYYPRRVRRPQRRAAADLASSASCLIWLAGKAVSKPQSRQNSPHSSFSTQHTDTAVEGPKLSSSLFQVNNVWILLFLLLLSLNPSFSLHLYTDSDSGCWSCIGHALPVFYVQLGFWASRRAPTFPNPPATHLRWKTWLCHLLINIFPKTTGYYFLHL